MSETSRPKVRRILSAIRADEIYSLQLLQAITGWGDSAVRSARVSGLRPVYLHGRVFFRGSDVTEYIDMAAEESQATQSVDGECPSSAEASRELSKNGSCHSPVGRRGATHGR